MSSWYVEILQTCITRSLQRKSKSVDKFIAVTFALRVSAYFTSSTIPPMQTITAGEIQYEHKRAADLARRTALNPQRSG